VADRDEMVEAYREFIREQTLRFERAMRELVKEMRTQRTEFRAEFRAQREESRAYFEVLNTQLKQQNKRIDDLSDESRAQTQALLRVIDRLDNGGAAPAT
jgi:hypothetical protein